MTGDYIVADLSEQVTSLSGKMPHLLGSPLPPGDKHAVSVSIPTWKQTEAWARRDSELLTHLKSGYPRFLIPHVVRELSEKLLKMAATKGSSVFDKQVIADLNIPNQLALLFAGEDLAISCRRNLRSHNKGTITAFRVTFDGTLQGIEDVPFTRRRCRYDDLFVVVYPESMAIEGKLFWQHTGFGISSRCATLWLENAPFLSKSTASITKTPNIPTAAADEAKVILRRRMGSLLSTQEIEVPMDGVYLYPTGMSAITHTATALRDVRGNDNGLCKVAVFGFLYVDTFKVMDKIQNFDCELYGHATPEQLGKFEQDLANGLDIDALYTEFPGNPLLGSVDLERLHRLSKKYDFVLIVDDTVATAVNVELLTYCDMICTSLTKMFSGSCNVMGGSLVLNPKCDHYESYQAVLTEQFVDTYYPEDALIMEQNSADFEHRVSVASENAERIAETLRHHPTVSRVFYPKGNPTQDIYDRFKRPNKGYGYLLSIRFVRPEAAVAFYDAFDVAKGPSLGTNFTLCCAYTLYAHFKELEWAAEYGVIEHLVRISIGVEETGHLDKILETALTAASEAYDSEAEEGGSY